MITQPTNYDPFAAALKALDEVSTQEKFGSVSIIAEKHVGSKSA